MSYKHTALKFIILIIFAPVIGFADQKVQAADSQFQLLPDDAGRAANAALFMHEGFKPSHVRGARIYDNFTIELGTIPNTSNNLLLVATATNPSKALPGISDGWRCSHCHG